MKTELARYRHRREAGHILGQQVRDELRGDDAIVLALPRGGVPVGLEVARAIDAALDVFVVRKLGVPGQPELAMGAIAAGGFELLNVALVADLGLTPFEIARVADRELVELRRREALYRGEHDPVEVHDKLVVLVDDGLATGFSMRAAIAAVRQREPRRIVVAVPVGAVETCETIADDVGTVICPLRPDPFDAVSEWYRDFAPPTDEEVRECLTVAAAERGPVDTAHAEW